jgi:hypothetical protein
MIAGTDGNSSLCAVHGTMKLTQVLVLLAMVGAASAASMGESLALGQCRMQQAVGLGDSEYHCGNRKGAPSLD